MFLVECSVKNLEAFYESVMAFNHIEDMESK